MKYNQTDNSINIFESLINRIILTNAEITGIYAPIEPAYNKDMPVVFVVKEDKTITKTPINEIKGYDKAIAEIQTNRRYKHKINYKLFDYTDHLKNLQHYFNRKRYK